MRSKDGGRNIKAIRRGGRAGLVSALSGVTWGTCQDEHDIDRGDTALTDTDLPPAGEIFFFLITAENFFGAEGPLGSSALGPRNNISPCL